MTKTKVFDNTHILFFSEPHGYIGYNLFKYCDKVLTEVETKQIKLCGVVTKCVHDKGYKDIFVAAPFLSKKELAKVKKLGYSSVVKPIGENK